MGESKTWGEFRKRMPPEDWAQIIDLFAESERTVPADETPFTSDDLPMWGDDGWYIGLWPPEEAVAWFPKDLLEKYDGHDDSTNPNRYQLFLPSDAAEEIADDLRARGHRVEKMLTGDLPYCAHPHRLPRPRVRQLRLIAGRPSVRHDVVALHPE